VLRLVVTIGRIGFDGVRERMIDLLLSEFQTRSKKPVDLPQVVKVSAS
jgi:hypothetical protein